MNSEQAQKLIIEVISKSLDDEVEITADMALIGGESLLDSMDLIEVCLALEALANKHGFKFDWTNKTPHSASINIFESVATLSEEFALQSNT